MVTGKGSIKYTYDAAGNKLKKTVHESGKPDGVTLYLFGNYVNDTLQYLPQHEGRIRYSTINSGFVYDYFVKDHLGNVRMMLTDEQQTNYYPAATLEGSQTAGALSMLNWEKQFYTIDNTKITAKTSVPGWTAANDYKNNNGNPPANSIASGSYPSNYTVTDGATSTNLYKTNAGSNKTALGMAIKVMAGDVVNIQGKSYFYAPSQTFSNTNSAVMTVTDILTAFMGTGGNAAAGKGITEPLMEGLNSGAFAIPSTFIRGTDGTTSSSPKAYINYIFFDEQFRYAGGGASRVGTSGTVKHHWNDAVLQNIPVPKNGYLYVYVSNESNQDVFFDNLQVIHTRGPILEETHYYPFGLSMAGISSRAAGGVENKKKYQQYELNTNFDINLYESFFRSHDPQLGRFWQIDPKPDLSLSPYSAMSNNPILITDPLGDTTRPPKTLIVPIPQKRWPNVYKTLMQYLNKGKSPLLTYDSDKKAADQRSRDAKRGHTPARKGFNLHEFPPKMTKEGGTGAIVNEIPERENKSEGGVVGNLIKDNNLQTKDKLLYEPVPDPDDPDNTVPVAGINQQQKPNNGTQSAPGKVISINSDDVKTGAKVGTAAIVIYILYKVVVAAATWECGGCGAALTP